MEKQEVIFTFRKATQNTYVYQEVPEKGMPPKIKALYIQKWVAGETAPKSLKVSIEEV